MVFKVKTYYINKSERIIKSHHMIKSSEYNSLDNSNKLKEIYEIFFKLLELTTLDFIRYNMEITTKRFFSGNVLDFKLHDCGHGNAHLSEVYSFTRLAVQSAKISNKIKNTFLIAALMHDESLAYGKTKKLHHIESAEYVTNNYIKAVTDGLLFPQNEPFEKKELSLIKDLIRTHRLNPAETVSKLKDLYPLIKEEILATVSVADKVGLMDVLNTRLNTSTPDYYPVKHFNKMCDRFFNEESKEIIIYNLNAMLGNEKDSQALWSFYTEAMKGGTQEHELMIKHDTFVIDHNKDR